MNKRTRRLVGGLGTAAAMLSTSAVAGTVSTAPALAVTTHTVVTPYIFSGGAYGTGATGGMVPVNPSRSAVVGIGCDNHTGRTADSHVVATDRAGVGTSEVESTVRTYHSSKVTDNVKATNTIESVSVGTGANRLEITGLRSVARSWHSSTGYHSTLTRAGSITVGGVHKAFPTPSHALTLPGIGTLELGKTTTVSSSGRTGNSGPGLLLHLDSTGSTVTLNYARSELRRALPAGLLGGRSFGSRLTGADGTLSSGATAPQSLPCIGTNGDVERNSTASTTQMSGDITLGATDDTARGFGGPKGTATATTHSTVNSVTIGSDGNAAVLKGLVATASVQRTSAGALKRSTAGTTPGTVTVNGTTTKLPLHGTYKVPGVATITTGLVKTTSTGISVTGAQVKLLSGTAPGSILELANASALIKR